MNRRRLATLHRRLAELSREQAEVNAEIAAALVEDESPESPGPGGRRMQRAPKVLPPERGPSEIERAAARKAIRRAELVGVKG